MASAQLQAVRRQEEVRVCGDPEGGYASRARQEDHQVIRFPGIILLFRTPHVMMENSSEYSKVKFFCFATGNKYVPGILLDLR